MESEKTPTQLAAEIPRLLARHTVDARLLELEITESMLITDPARAEATLTRLSQVGLTLSVDDFGTSRACFPRARQRA